MFIAEFVAAFTGEKIKDGFNMYNLIEPLSSIK